ncbi:MAG: hypothetical protein AB2687_18460 [Candidatus Thiodiazotropha taylori]
MKLTKDEIEEWKSNYIIPELRNILHRRNNDKPIGIFIDAIDEAFGPIRSEIIDEQPLGYKTWVAVQCGFIQSSLELKLITGNVYRVYGAIRTEAYSQYPYSHTQDKSQIVETCVNMTYKKDTLINIFEKNIDNTSDKYLASIEKDQHKIKKFFPIDTFDYPHAWGFKETAVEWIIRHTFYIPRHLVWHGQNILINHPDPESRRSRNSLRETIASTSREIFNGYKQQVEWDDTIEEALKHISSNVLTSAEVDSLDLEKFPDLKPIEFLYKRGLIGVPKSSNHETDSFTQHFLIAGLHKTAQLPKASYYILHPCLTTYVIDLIPHESQDKFFLNMLVAGNDLPCPVNLKPKLIIHTPKNSLDLKIDFNKDGIDTFHGLGSFTIADFDLSKPAYVFIVSLLMAMKKSNNYWVTPENISHEVKYLRKRQYIHETYGNKPKGKNSPLYAEEYFLEKLNIQYSEDKPYFWQESINFIKNKFDGLEIRTKKV